MYILGLHHDRLQVVVRGPVSVTHGHIDTSHRIVKEHRLTVKILTVLTFQPYINIVPTYFFYRHQCTFQPSKLNHKKSIIHTFRKRYCQLINVLENNSYNIYGLVV